MRAMALAATVTAGMAGGAAAAEWAAFVKPDCTVALTRGGRDVASIVPGLFQKEWRGAGPRAPRPAPASEPRRTVIRAPDGQEVDCELRARPAGEGVLLSYRLTPRQPVELNSLHVSLEMPEAVARGASFVADGTEGAFPAERGSTHLYGSAPTRALALRWPDGGRLELTAAEALPMLVQDNRQWGPSFSVRIGPQMGPARAWPAGETLAVEVVLSAPGGIGLTIDEPVTLAPGPDWVPLDVQLDIEPGSALDFSAFRPTDMPAGKHGRVIATPDGHFAFADSPDVPRRFYGVNLCFTAQYLAPDQAEALAERLMRLGYNAVRFHHHESVLADRAGGVSTAARPDAFDQLDHLVAALKQRGIYMTTDLYVSRQVYASEIWPGAEGTVGMDEFKMLVLVNEQAFANFAAWTRSFLGHRNPRTGLRYAEEPALAWLSLINEGNAGNFIYGLSERARADWQHAWSAWLARTYGSAEAVAAAWGRPLEGALEAGTAAFPRSFTEDTAPARDFAAFLADTELAFFRRARALIREELGCEALLTNMNAWTNPLPSQLVRLEFDYVDDHFYVDHPQFLEQPWRLPSRCPNTSPVAAGAPGGRHTAFTRLLGKPFTITEYNYSGPGRYRGVGGILTGCMAALQDWSAVWRFAYSHTRDNLFKVSAAGYFDLVSDPLNQAAERASLCLFLRGDLAPAGRTVAITADPDEVRGRRVRPAGLVPPWSGLVTVARVGCFLGGRDAQVPADVAFPITESAPVTPLRAGAAPYSDAAGQAILRVFEEQGWLAHGSTNLAERRTRSPDGQFALDGPADTMVLDTPRTAGCFAPAGRKVELGAAAIEIQGTEATVWVSSLDGAPIAESRRLLITHLTDLQNTGISYADGARTTLLAWGSPPHLVRDGGARVTLRLARPARAQAWALSTGGRRLAPVPVRVDGQTLTLELAVRGESGARMLYELVVETL